jgi:predicted membrane protein
MQKVKGSGQRSGKALVGLILLVIGCILLLQTLDLFFIPSWVLSWPVFLILIGCFIGARQGYNQPSAFMPIIIGLLFLSNRILPDMNLSRLFWPSMIIALGIWMITGKKNRRFPGSFGNWNNESDPVQPGRLHIEPEGHPGEAAEDRIESVSIFGGVKKNIVSKNFKGGEIVNFFGGSEINLIQADINGRVNLEVVQVFGGTKIIVPANWTIHSEMVAIFGGIEDKRPPQPNAAGDKILVIQGTSIFGGIDIKSF